MNDSLKTESAYAGNRTKPNPEQPDRCPSIDPLDTLQCGRRAHDDDQCQLGGIGWKKGARAQDIPPVLYHWSPGHNRASIQRDGLRPGSPSNTFPEWCPPHICYGETPASALGLTLLDEPLDLWMVRTDGHAFTPANEGAEWRSAERVEAWWVGSRPPRDPVIDMTQAEQAEADEIVAYLHEQDIADVDFPPGRSGAANPTSPDSSTDQKATDLWLVTKVGVYDHGVCYVGDTEPDAQRFTQEYAPDHDGYHEWRIDPIQIGVPTGGTTRRRATPAPIGDGAS